MKILAIDPGQTESAYVCWDTKRHDFVGDLGMGDEAGSPIKSMGIVANKNEIFNVISRTIINIDIRLIAVEMMQSYGHAVGRSVFETVLMIGCMKECAFYEAAIIPITNIEFKLYTRTVIKGALGGCRTDTDVRQAIRQRYGESRKGEKLEGVRRDIWSALALAIALEENPSLKEW